MIMQGSSNCTQLIFFQKKYALTTALILAFLTIGYVYCVPKEINVGVLLSYHLPHDSNGNVNPYERLGLEAFAAVSLAVNEINEGTVGILGLKTPIIDPTKYQLKIYNYSDEFTKSTTLLSVIDLEQKANVAVIFGCIFSSLSTVASMISAPFFTPIISGSSTSASLSDKGLYPTFTRTVASDSYQGSALAKIAFDFGWKNVAILHADDLYSVGLAQDIQSACKELNILVRTSIQFVAGTATDINTQIEELRASRALIVYLIAELVDVLDTIKSLYQVGLIGATSEYVYLGSDAWMNQDFIPELYKVFPNLSTLQKVSIVEGLMGTNSYAGEGSDAYKSWSARFLSSPVTQSIWSMYGDNSTSLALSNAGVDAPFYDAVYLVAHAFSNLITLGQDPSIVTEDLKRNLLKQMKNVTFNGVSGNNIQLLANGDLAEAYMTFYGIHNGELINLCVVSSSKTPYSNQNEAGALIYWPSGSKNIPKDSIPLPPVKVVVCGAHQYLDGERCVSCEGRKSVSNPVAGFCDICQPGYYNENLVKNNTWYYGNFTFNCLECPSGSICPGNIQTQSEAGFIATTDPDTFAYCKPAVACSNVQSNWTFAPSVNTTFSPYCSDGYIGSMCQSCLFLFYGYNSTTSYYRYNLECLPCNTSNSNLIWTSVALLILIFISSYFFYKNSSLVRNAYHLIIDDLKLFQIFVTFVQTLGSFRNIGLSWGQIFTSMLHVASGSNFDLQLFGPECFFRLSYAGRWFLQLFLPIFVMISVSFYYLIYNKIAIYRNVEVMKKNRYFKYMLKILNFSYFLFAYNSLSTFDCSVNAGKMYLNSEPSVECDSVNDPNYRLIFIPAILSTILFVVGIPVLFSLLIFMNRREINEIQRYSHSVLKGESFRQSNQIVDKINESPLHFLYSNFRPNFFYWPVVIILRKLMIAVVLMYISSDQNFKALMVIVVLLTALVLQYSFRPYLNHFNGRNFMNNVEITSIFVLILTLVCGLALTSTYNDLHNLMIILKPSQSEVVKIMWANKRLDFVRAICIIFISTFCILFVSSVYNYSLTKKKNMSKTNTAQQATQHSVMNPLNIMNLKDKKRLVSSAGIELNIIKK